MCFLYNHYYYYGFILFEIFRLSSPVIPRSHFLTTVPLARPSFVIIGVQKNKKIGAFLLTVKLYFEKNPPIFFLDNK